MTGYKLTDEVVADIMEWRKKRTAASFWLETYTKEAATQVQQALSVLGVNGFVTMMGNWRGIVLYLNDNLSPQ
jgi:hypothetical protein